MFRSLLVLALLFVSQGLAAQDATDETKADPRTELSTAIPHATKLLEDKKYQDFLKTYVHPDDMKRVTAKISLEQFVEIFASSKAEKLLDVLHQIEDVKPKLTDDGQTAEFTFENEVENKQTIRFKKHEKFWYIVN